MKLVYTDHLKTRLKQRGIQIKIVREIFENGQENYWDELRSRHIIVATVVYKEKLRKVLAAYDRIGARAEVVTVHPIGDEEIQQRLESGRWTYEEIKN